MSDLISREDIPYIDLNGDMPRSKVRVWVAFKEQIDALPSADRPIGWIPVSERLPDLKTEVIYSFDGIVSTGYMTDRDYEGEKIEPHWEDLESGVTIEPIAWMPLPEPYKGGDDSE